MRFPDPPRRAPAEPMLPLINVIFLLLVFVLMVAELAPPDPVPVTPPAAVPTGAAAGPVVLLLGPDGVPRFGAETGEAALAAVAAACGAGCAGVTLRADAAMPAAALAAILPRLPGPVTLTTVARPGAAR